ncbi:MAG: RHS repeat-associated core domain-containing protein [Terriglobales bacterium]
MLPAAEERTLALTSAEETFSLAAGVALAALETHQGANAARGKKPHQGIFSKNRALRVGEIWAKWSGTHQDRKCWWSKTVSGSALDANGNTLSDPSGKSYSWDFENRLVSAAVPGTETVAFKYDPFGRRIYKQSPNFAGSFLYDGKNLIETVSGSGSEIASYTHGGDLDQPYAELRSGTVSYYEQDAANSVTSLSNPTGVVAATYTYDSFGNVTNSTGTLRNPFQYTGRELDSETGLNYNRARYYNSATGRFISEDPLGFGGSGPNFYPYVRNDPADLIDPLGLTNCVVTPLGTVCSDWNTNWSWMEPQPPGPPPLPSDLKPNPLQQAPPPCKCDMVEMDREVDRVVWKNTKHEIFFWEPIFMSGEGGAEFFEWQFGKRWIPAVKWVKVGVEVYDTYEEVEKIREKYRHCGWGF